jgi:succinyl-diaminopimelate desuccinylase
VGSGNQTERTSPRAVVARPVEVIELLTCGERSGSCYLPLLMSTLVDTLAWLVGIPSPTGSEAAICKAISERLAAHPVRVVQESVVIGEPSDRKVLLVGHIDTVPLQGETGARIEGGRLHGLGSTDMKGGLAVMIHLIEALETDGLVGIFYAGEEGPIRDNQLARFLTPSRV